MKKLVLLLPLFALLTACQSKKEICARRYADEISPAKTRQLLGLSPDGNIGGYCDFYKK